MATVKSAKTKLVKSFKKVESIKSSIAQLEEEIEALRESLEDAVYENHQAHKNLKEARSNQDPEGVTFEVHGTQSDSCKIQFISASFETFDEACRAVVGKELPSNMIPKELLKIPNSPKAGRKQVLATYNKNNAWGYKKAANKFFTNRARKEAK